MELIHSEDASKLYCHNPKTVSGLIYQWLSMLGLKSAAGFLFHQLFEMVSGYDENQQGRDQD